MSLRVFALFIVAAAASVLSMIIWKGPEGAGQVGDSFGLANAILVSLNLYFVITTLREQRSDFAAQLREMKAAREFAERPLVMLVPDGFAVVRAPQPRKVGDAVHLYSTLAFSFLVQNHSSDPAVGIELSGSLEMPEHKIDSEPTPQIFLCSTTLPNENPLRSQLETGVRAEQLEVLARSQSDGRVVLVVTATYANVSGGRFRAVHRFAVVANSTADSAQLLLQTKEWIGEKERTGDALAVELPDVRLKISFAPDGYEVNPVL